MNKPRFHGLRWILLLLTFGVLSWGLVVYQLSKLENDLLIAAVSAMAVSFLVLGALWANEIKKSEEG